MTEAVSSRFFYVLSNAAYLVSQHDPGAELEWGGGQTPLPAGRVRRRAPAQRGLKYDTYVSSRVFHQAQSSYLSMASSPAVYPFSGTLFILSPAASRSGHTKPCRARFLGPAPGLRGRNYIPEQVLREGQNTESGRWGRHGP